MDDSHGGVSELLMAFSSVMRQGDFELLLPECRKAFRWGPQEGRTIGSRTACERCESGYEASLKQLSPAKRNGLSRWADHLSNLTGRDPWGIRWGFRGFELGFEQLIHGVVACLADAV